MSDIKDFSSDPFQQFQKWFQRAQRFQVFRFLYPSTLLGLSHAMTLATATKEGKPSARMVLLKEYSPRGFVFYTHYESRKAEELTQNPQAALVFYWGFPQRQIRIEGSVSKLTHEESSQYWKTRPRGSQLSGLASQQSKVILNREQLEEKINKVNEEYRGQEIPCPTVWGGFCLKPELFEFWEGRVNRLHDRICYTQKSTLWEMSRLSP